MELNFYFTANKQNYKLRVDPRDRIYQYLYRFNANQKELHGINIYGVSLNDNKLDIGTPIKDAGINEGDTLIIDSELPSEENKNDNTTKYCIKPYSILLGDKFEGLYEGDLKNGLPDGNGRLFHIPGFYYKGEWKEGKKEGKGYETDLNGGVYEGDFKNDKRNGKGTFTTYDGEVYEGDWVEGKKEGKGKTVYPNGDTYEGDYKNGLGNGKGKITWTNGNEYEGEIIDDLMNGKGIFKYLNGDIYEGEFSNDKKNGKGILKYINGTVYEGEWKENDANGKGILKMKNGDIFEGEFTNNEYDGFGKMTYADGRIEEGMWESGEFMKDYNTEYSYCLECIKTFNKNDNSMNPIFQLKDGRLLFCLGDGTLNIYNMDNYEIALSIKEHSEGFLSCIQLNDGRLVTYSQDHKMKLIKLTEDKGYEVISRIELDDDYPIKVIEIKNNEIMAITKKKIIKVWNLDNLQNTKNFEENCDDILLLNDEVFVTSSLANKCIKFWSLNTYENIKTINDLKLTDSKQSMYIFEDNILCIGGCNKFYFIDIKNYEIINVFDISGLVTSVKKSFVGNFICSIYNSNKNNHIVIYKYDKKSLTKLFEKKKVHEEIIINCIELDNRIIISGELYKNAEGIKIWKLQDKKNN